jgi:hypothetical protein
MPPLYHYPKLSQFDGGLFRSPGPGLGNLLFPIARAIAGQCERGGTLVYPTMRQFKIGPYLRREADKRTYGDVLRHRTGYDWRNWLASQSLPAISERDAPADLNSGCICYEGMDGHFLSLLNYSEEIRAWIGENGRFKGSLAQPYNIAIHVRVSDFIDDDGTEDGFNVRQSWDWYKHAVDEARRLIGKTAPSIMLFTDIDAAEARAGLAVANVATDPSKNALTAMMNMAQSEIIVTSRSTFSMWGAFLGNSAAIWNSKMAVSRYFPVREGQDFFV